jgi:hypothetical protein
MPTSTKPTTMKTFFLCACAPSAAAVSLMAAFFVSASSLFAADDLNAAYQKGREAFHKGDFATAQAFLTQVAAANPGHTDTQNMLRYIKAHAKPEASTLRRDYAAVTIPKIEMEEVTLTEALAGLRLLSKNASAGKVSPNVIVKGTDLSTKKLSLSLSNVPLSEALEYLAQLTGSKVSYEKHAAILSEATAAAETASKAK